MKPEQEDSGVAIRETRRSCKNRQIQSNIVDLMIHCSGRPRDGRRKPVMLVEKLDYVQSLPYAK
jgi:hypothetical protein